MLHIFYLLVLLKITNCVVGEVSAVEKPSDTVLCRSCGIEILATDSIISKPSPVSLRSFYEATFNNDTILVQVLSKDSLLQFPVITSTHSACLGVGEWEEDDYWFPDYKWRTCVCTECGAILGWIFESIDPYSVVIPTQFYGLILPNLVAETCKYFFSGIGQNCGVLIHTKCHCPILSCV